MRVVNRRYLAEERNFEFGTVLEESLNEIYICDAKTFKFIQVNKGARRNLGYNMRELSEMTPLDASDDATRKKILDTAPSMIDGSRDKFVYYGVNKRKDGSTYEVEAHVQHMLFNGRPVYLTVVLDITARKKAERLLREAHEELEQRVNERTAELETMTKIAEHANAGKTRFLSAASHDLRQPLQALQLYLSALTARLDHPKSKRLSDKMQLSLNTISGLLDSLLDTSALESGAVKPFKKSVALSEVLNRIVNVSKQQATKKGLEFHCESVSCSIHTDPGLLERVVANFIANAIRYTVQGVIEIRCEQIDDFVRISVVDTGVGISETQLESVFDEYFQVDDPAIKQKKGLGLGLSIAKYIARLLDHPIRVKSIIGQGSTFSIDVPLGTAAVEPARSSVIDSAKFGHFTSRPTVLMVDDDPDVMDAMIELVSTFDVELHTAMNGNEALDQVRGGLRPELLISDFRMPGMNGLELTNAVRKILNRDLPVIIMTGDISTAKIKEANLVNCSAFLKPIKVEELMPLIEAARAHAP